VRVCVVAEYYPRPDDPVSGVWAHRQALAVRGAGADVRVLVLDRRLPSAAALREAALGRPRRLFAESRAAAARPRNEVLDGIEVEYVRFLSPPRELSYARWHRWARRPLRSALSRGRRFDLVHAHYAHLAGAAALDWTAPRRVPLVVSVHGGDVLAPTLQGRAAQATIAHVLREAAEVMCNSRGTLRRAAALAGRDDHMRVVHLGTDVPAEHELPEKHARPTVATLGHAIPRKRHDDVLRALALLQPEVRWTAIGDGPELPRLKALARELGVAERVTLAGQLAPREAHDELARSHVMALPSLDEAFGVAYVEALAHGVPAIGCAGESGPEEIAELSRGGGAGARRDDPRPMLLVPPRDPPALAAAIERAIADPALPPAARAAAAAHFTWKSCGDATLAAYEAAVRR
jgi:teichuronic acid biosynthesis glycosyltransferase TuaC